MSIATKTVSLNLVLLGGPGAGKGTQAKRLETDFSLTHISTGDILRSEVVRETELGLKAKKYMDEGDLVPDNLIIKMVESEIERHSQEGFLFDGFPRTVGQAEALDDIIVIDKVIYLEVGREEAVRRLSARRVCENCGENYNLLFKRSSEEGICDKCGGSLYQRKDDKPEVIKERYDTFWDKTAPLIDYYVERELLTRVDGEQGPDEVYSRIRSILDILG